MILRKEVSPFPALAAGLPAVPVAEGGAGGGERRWLGDPGRLHTGLPLDRTRWRAQPTAHDRRILKHEEQIEALKQQVPEWISNLKRPVTPAIVPPFGPLEGIRVVSTGIIVAQPYIGTKLAEFGAEVIHVERPGGDPYQGMAPLLTRGPREHSCDEAEITKSKLSLGLDLK